ncbi:MAG TPA: histidine phosphatase family protein [Frankiaceae bacterium]|nr:histidine phosphatase family protein [Frankiaceae bacterium]
MTDAADLIVWRHGRTEWNDLGVFQGQADPPLDAVGHAQARAAAVVLAAFEPRVIVSSDLARARDTAAYLASSTGLPLTLDERLREMDVGEWSGRTREEIAQRFPETYAAWMDGADVRREGGENMADLAARVSESLREHLADAGRGRVVVVTHGGTARVAVLSLLGLPVECWSGFSVLANARWAALDRRRAGWRLMAYNVGVAAEQGPPGSGAASAEPVL